MCFFLTGWNQWRAASYGAAAWVGTLCIASKVFGHDPNTLPFLGEPAGPGEMAPTGANAEDIDSEQTWRTILAVSIFPVMILFATVNRIMYRHVSLAEEVARPPNPLVDEDGHMDEGPVAAARKARMSDKKRVADLDSSQGRYRERGYYSGGNETVDGQNDVETGRVHTNDDDVPSKGMNRQHVKGGKNQTAGGRKVRRLPPPPPKGPGVLSKTMSVLGAVARVIGRTYEASVACVLGSRAERGVAAKQTAIAFARSRHRRDRVVAWLCEFRNLTSFDQSLHGRVEEAGGNSPRLAKKAVEELLALVYVLLADADIWVRFGGEPMSSAAMKALASAAGAASRHDPRLAWRAIPLFARALRSPHPELRGAAAEALCDETFASVAASLLFHRHDVGLRRPRMWELRR